MHQSHRELEHGHVFQSPKHASERKTAFIFFLTIVTMVVEIVVGWFSHSMALFADGWHMGTHAAALGIALVTYVLARKYATDGRFAYGTWKIEILGAYTSSIVLGMVALSMFGMSIMRLIQPEPIDFNDALIVAVIGLAVNVASVLILSGGTGSSHNHSESHGPDQEPHPDHAAGERRDHPGRDSDLNLKSAIAHVLADALTSVLAILALLGAKFFAWNFLDPLMGIAGALLIAHWTIGLCKNSGSILIDKEMDAPIVEQIRRCIESDGETRISDLHVWRVAASKYACSIVLARTRAADTTIADYKKRLRRIPGLVHSTIEIHELAAAPAPA